MRAKDFMVILKAFKIADDNLLSKDEKAFLLDELHHEFLTNDGYSEEEILEIKEFAREIAREIETMENNKKEMILND